MYRPHSRSREKSGDGRGQEVPQQEEQETDALLDVNEYNEKRFILLAESLRIKSCKVVRKLFKGRNKSILKSSKAKIVQQIKSL